MSGTRTVRTTQQDQAEVLDHGWRVILFNDDLHAFDAVLFALQRAAGLSLEVAEMVTYEAHSTGQAVVKCGLRREEGLTICERLRAYTRIEGRSAGVACQVEHG